MRPHTLPLAIVLASTPVLSLSLSGCVADTQSAGVADSAEFELRSPIANFHVVRRGLYRGARPDEAALRYLRSNGVKTIVNLESTDLIDTRPGDIDREREVVESLGMEFIHQPMNVLLPVDDTQMDETLAILADPLSGPIFVHCKHGQDRTGLVIGLERVLIEGWEPALAYEEMKSYGFHTFFLALKHYFEKKTNWDE